MKESEILSISSRSVLGRLERGSIRILLNLADQGELNQKELGQRTSKNRTTTGFDRWGVKKRLEGTSEFPSLIDYDYVKKFPINKKETHYRLTLKGFLACLGYLEFNQVYLIKKYSEILHKYTNNKKIKIILDSIENETKYFLFSFHLQGINWLRSKYILSYMDELQFKDNTIDFPFSGIFRDSHSKEDFDLYEKIFHQCITSYKKSHATYHDIPSKTAFREYINTLKGKKFNPKIRESIALFLYHKYWKLYMPTLEKFNDRQLVGIYFMMKGYSTHKEIQHLTSDDRKLYMENQFESSF